MLPVLLSICFSMCVGCAASDNADNVTTHTHIHSQFRAQNYTEPVIHTTCV